MPTRAVKEFNEIFLLIFRTNLQVTPHFFVFCQLNVNHLLQVFALHCTIFRCWFSMHRWRFFYCAIISFRYLFQLNFIFLLTHQCISASIGLYLYCRVSKWSSTLFYTLRAKWASFASSWRCSCTCSPWWVASCTQKHHKNISAIFSRLLQLCFRWAIEWNHFVSAVTLTSSSLSVKLSVVDGITVLFTRIFVHGQVSLPVSVALIYVIKMKYNCTKLLFWCSSILLITVFAEIVALGAYFFERKNLGGPLFRTVTFFCTSPFEKWGFRGLTISGSHYSIRGYYFGKYGDYFFSRSVSKEVFWRNAQTDITFICSRGSGWETSRILVKHLHIQNVVKSFWTSTPCVLSGWKMIFSNTPSAVFDFT